MPYLEVSQGNQDELEEVEEVKVPNIEGMSIKDAEKKVKELGLEISIESDIEVLDKDETMILKQTPKEGVAVNKGSKVYVKVE